MGIEIFLHHITLDMRFRFASLLLLPLVTTSHIHKRCAQFDIPLNNIVST